MARVETVLVSSTKAYEATGPDGSQVTVKNLGPDSCVFATASTVSSGSNDGTLTSGSTLAFTPSKFFLSSGTSNLQVSLPPSDPFRQYDKDNGQAGATVARANSTLTLVANRAFVVRFRPSRTMTVVKIGFSVGTGAGADDACDVGIYDAALKLIVSKGATTGLLNTTGVKSPTITSTTLQANGTYYVALSCGTLGGSAGVLAGEQRGAASAWLLYGAAAPQLEGDFMAAAHPLPATITAGGGTPGMPALVVLES